MCEDEILGEGAFGEVTAGYTTTTTTASSARTSPLKKRALASMKEKVAIKRLVKSRLSPTMREHLRVEVDVLKRCQGLSGVVQLRDIFETEEEAYLVMDYVNGGDLFDFVVSRGRLEESLARHVFGQLVEVVHHLHNRLMVIHHDIKLENVLLHKTEGDNTIAARLTDFGLCCPVQRADDPLTKFSGTEAYCSPDLLMGRPYSGGANDVYCLGVLLYICVTGSYPFDSDDVELQVRQQTNYAYLSTLAFPSDVSRECRDLVLTMLNPNMRKRLTIEQVAAHPFLAPYFANIKAKQLQQQQQHEVQQQLELGQCDAECEDDDEEQCFFLEEDDEEVAIFRPTHHHHHQQQKKKKKSTLEVNECEISVADEEEDEESADEHDDRDCELRVMVDEDDCIDDEAMMMLH